MLIAIYASAALICLASLLIGRAILCVLGRQEVTWLEGPVGFAALITASSLAIRAPHRATTTLVLLLALIALSILYLRGRALPSGSLRVAVPIVLVTGLAASLPFIASAHSGLLGVGINNDLALHLHLSAWLEHPTGLTPTELANGYPIGPQGLVAAVSKGIGAEPLSPMLGLLLAIPVLTALAALAVLREMPPARRTIAAVLVALSYLAASTLSIGGFKETVMALLVVGFTLTLRELARREEGRTAALVALGVLMAGMLAVWSYPGVLYAAVIAGLWGAIEIAAAWLRGDRERIRVELRRAARLAVIPLGAMLVIGLAELPRLLDFERWGAVGFVTNVNSRLKEAISPLEALGSWPSADFIDGTGGLDGYWVFGILGLVALVVGIVLAWRRGERALLAGVAGAALIYLGTQIHGGFYVQQKALEIVAPILMLLVLAALLGGRPSRPRTALAVAFVAVAAYSSFLVLRDARVAPRQYGAAQLAALRPQLQDKRVLSLTTDRFTDYYLRGAEVVSPGRFAQQLIQPRLTKYQRLPVDFDSVEPAVLDQVDYALTTRAAYKSAAPANFEPVAQTGAFVLWKRTGPTRQIGVINEAERPGRILRCNSPRGQKQLAAAEAQGYTTALVQPASVIGKRFFWKPSSSVPDGGRITQVLKLPAGRWQLSLQYYSPVLDLTVGVGDARVALPPTTDSGFRFRTDQGAFWPVGPVTSDGRPVVVTVSAGGPSGLQELLGVDQPADIGNLTAAQPDAAHQVPLQKACGMYVDHFIGPAPAAAGKSE